MSTQSTLDAAVSRFIRDVSELLGETVSYARHGENGAIIRYDNGFIYFDLIVDQDETQFREYLNRIATSTGVPIELTGSWNGRLRNVRVPFDARAILTPQVRLELLEQELGRAGITSQERDRLTRQATDLRQQIETTLQIQRTQRYAQLDANTQRATQEIHGRDATEIHRYFRRIPINRIVMFLKEKIGLKPEQNIELKKKTSGEPFIDYVKRTLFSIIDLSADPSNPEGNPYEEKKRLKEKIVEVTQHISSYNFKATVPNTDPPINFEQYITLVLEYVKHRNQSPYYKYYYITTYISDCFNAYNMETDRPTGRLPCVPGTVERLTIALRSATVSITSTDQNQYQLLSNLIGFNILELINTFRQEWFKAENQKSPRTPIPQRKDSYIRFLRSALSVHHLSGDMLKIVSDNIQREADQLEEAGSFIELIEEEGGKKKRKKHRTLKKKPRKYVPSSNKKRSKK